MKANLEKIMSKSQSYPRDVSEDCYCMKSWNMEAGLRCMSVGLTFVIITHNLISIEINGLDALCKMRTAKD